MIKRIKKWMALSIISAILVSSWLVYYAIAPLKLQPGSQEISIQPKSGLRSIANQLVAQGVLKEPWRFILLAKLLHKEQFLQA
ncbi:MAG TPA: aminodeoxychorismate lyase, partial [Methylotenera sp.]